MKFLFQFRIYPCAFHALQKFAELPPGFDGAGGKRVGQLFLFCLRVCGRHSLKLGVLRVCRTGLSQTFLEQFAPGGEIARSFFHLRIIHQKRGQFLRKEGVPVLQLRSAEPVLTADDSVADVENRVFVFIRFNRAADEAVSAFGNQLVDFPDEAVAFELFGEPGGKRGQFLFPIQEELFAFAEFGAE